MTGWFLTIAIWFAMGLLWWVVSLVILLAESTQRSAPGQAVGSSGAPVEPRISVFKAIAGPLSAEDLGRLRPCVESFVAELDERSEMLVGVAEADRDRVSRWLGELRELHPCAEIKVVTYGDGASYANHKIWVMKALARQARGELWFWSDADIEVPPGTLRSLREDFASRGAGFVTSPYIVRSVAAHSDVLDQLFVNLEFLPGVALLGRLGLIRFGFGAGMLFEAAAFEHRVSWDDLGASLADDYRLGRLLGAGRLGRVRLATLPSSNGWTAALLHYLRWHKTIRWCRPASYAAQVAVLPALGAGLVLLRYPSSPLPWIALAAVVAVDCAAAAAICAVLGTPLAWRRLPATALWSVLRPLVWAACWLPWPIVWRDQTWWSPRRSLTASTAAAATRAGTPYRDPRCRRADGT